MRLLPLLLVLAASPALAATPLRVMTYNVLHGQPCSGGSIGSEVAQRMELAVQGPSSVSCDLSNPTATCGLADLAPDILGMQEVSQVFRNLPVSEDQACLVLSLLPEPVGGVPPGVSTIEAFEHAGDYLLRRLNGVTAARAETSIRPGASPYAMRFVRDNPRLLPLVPDVSLPPDDKALTHHSSDLSNLELGLATISKLRIQQVTVHNLTIGLVPGETRAIQHATLRDAAGNPYDFYNSHLTTTGGSSPQTVLMATEIARFIQTTRRHPENPGFFTCDCNAAEGSATHQLFESAGYVDTFRFANPVDPGLTSGRDGLRIDDGCDETVGSRIDYVWALPDANGEIFDVTSSKVVMEFNATAGKPGDCRWPSDHNGVLTTFDTETRIEP